MEEKYKKEINKIENSFKEKISHFDDLLNINDIVYNTYIKSKENYYHNINIINLLINYYEKGNIITKELEHNEDFMETVNQKKHERNEPKKEKINNLNIIQKENQFDIIRGNNKERFSYSTLKKQSDNFEIFRIDNYKEELNFKTVEYKKRTPKNIKKSKSIIECSYCKSIDNLRRCLCKMIICKNCLDTQKNTNCIKNCYIFKNGSNYTSTIYNLSKYPLYDNTEIILYFEKVSWVRSGITFSEEMIKDQNDDNSPKYDVYIILEDLVQYYTLKNEWKSLKNDKINPLKKGDKMTIIYKKKELHFSVNNNYIRLIEIDSNKKKDPYLLVQCRNENSKVKILSITQKLD